MVNWSKYLLFCLPPSGSTIGALCPDATPEDNLDRGPHASGTIAETAVARTPQHLSCGSGGSGQNHASDTQINVQAVSGDSKVTIQMKVNHDVSFPRESPATILLTAPRQPYWRYVYGNGEDISCQFQRPPALQRARVFRTM